MKKLIALIAVCAMITIITIVNFVAGIILGVIMIFPIVMLSEGIIDSEE